MNRVVTFRRSVKIRSERAREIVIISGRFLSSALPLTDPPIIIGSKGKTHGANTVSKPAINAPNSKNMDETFFYIVGSRMKSHP